MKDEVFAGTPLRNALSGPFSSGLTSRCYADAAKERVDRTFTRVVFVHIAMAVAVTRGVLKG